MTAFNKTDVQEKWAYNKYWVMAKSPKIYAEIRQLFKNNQLTDSSIREFNNLLKEAENTDLSSKHLIVAYQHIWGYFKKIATKEEKEQYLLLIDSIDQNPDSLLRYLQELTFKYQIPYLINSKIIVEGL